MGNSGVGAAAVRIGAASAGTGGRLGLLLLACALAFNAVCLVPELRIGQVPLNDLVFHRAAAERLGVSLGRGEPFLDPWVSEWSLGYPVWRTYQPLPHLLGALALWLTRTLADPAAVFAALLYGLVVTLPLSVYGGARLLGLSRAASGLTALLALAPSATGDPGRYGLGYGSVVWRGSGLYTQLVALHLAVLAIGATARALDVRWRPALASLLLALTALAHIVFGYAAFVSAALLAVIGPRHRRSERIVRLATIIVPALVLLAWFLVPLVAGKEIVNHSRWEDVRKWDSYGAPFILSELFAGRLLDFGRPPLLSLLVGLGAAGALLCSGDALARRLLGLSGLWLAIFFGRETWGHLLLLAGVPAHLHLHRLQAAFELSAVLLAGFGLTHLVALLAGRACRLGMIGGLALGLALVPIGYDRARYLRENRTWGEANLAAYEKEHADLEAALADMRALLLERPGRASAGLASTWGGRFKVGDVPVHAFLAREHIDEVSFLYHSMSKPSDVMVLRDESSPAHDVAYGVRAVITPADRPMPPHLRQRSVHGRFAVYESSPEGYFGLVDLGGHYTGPASTQYEPSAAWLASPLLRSGIVISLDPRAPVGPAVGRWQALPSPSPGQLSPRGHILSEAKASETYTARVQLDRPAHVFVKVTWSPDLVATVDGQRARLLHVTPGFGAVAVPDGQHSVSVSYQPGILRAVLLLVGIGLFLLGSHGLRSARAPRGEAALAARLAGAGRRLATPRAVTGAILVASAVVALHPLFRGKLIDGHDAIEYPPRLVEMARAISEGHVPPIWAPDLGAGHGQPLFEFAPPLAYAAALPFHALGLGLADSLQLGLAALYFLGAIASYRIGRGLGARRPAALGGAIAWLFAPYVSLDLFVRAAFAEAAAVAVLPMALLGLLRAMDDPTPQRIAPAAAAVALIPLGHNGVALLAVPALALVAAVGGAAGLLRRGDARSGSGIARLAPLASGSAAIVLGLGLAAYFWLPALLEKGFVQTQRLRQGFLHWSEHVVWPVQLLWSGWGYGVSVPGPRDGMSFALGPLHLGLGVAGLLLGLRTANPRHRAYAIAFATAAAAGAWLSTDWAGPIWTRAEALQYLAYPWRALLLPGLFLPVLAVFAFERVGPRWTVAFLTILVLVNLPHTEPRGFLKFDDEYYAPQSIAKRGLNTTTREEYEPRWVETRPPYDPRGLVGVTGPVEVTEISRRAARQEFLVRAPEATTVEASTFFYPGWAVAVDGVPTAVSPVPVRGTMTFALPAGAHSIVITLGQTGTRRAGLAVTLSALTLLGVASAAALWRRRRRSLTHAEF